MGRAILTMLVARFSSPCVAHVNIAGRGSTIRKVFLLTIARAFGLRYVLHLHDYNYADYFRSRGAFLKKLIEKSFRGAATVVVLGRGDPAARSKCIIWRWSSNRRPDGTGALVALLSIGASMRSINLRQTWVVPAISSAVNTTRTNT